MKRIYWLVLWALAIATPLAVAGGSFTGVDRTTTGLVFHFTGGDYLLPILSSGGKLTNSVPLQLSSGSTAAAPAMAFSSAVQTGLFNSGGTLGFTTNGVQAGTVDNGADWTLGPVSGSATHKIQSGSTTIVDMIGGSTSPSFISFQQNAGSTYGYVGVDYSNTMCAGSSNHDLVIESNTSNIDFSANNGVSVQGSLKSSTGAWTLGASGVQNVVHQVNGFLSVTNVSSVSGAAVIVPPDVTIPQGLSSNFALSTSTATACFFIISQSKNGAVRVGLYSFIGNTPSAALLGTTEPDMDIGNTGTGSIILTNARTTQDGSHNLIVGVTGLGCF